MSVYSESVARHLPNDVARCHGVGNDEEGWREGCEQCLRRIVPTIGDRAVYMTPPPIIAFECEYLIEAEK